MAKVEVREGVHVADRETVSVKEAGDLWLRSCDAAGLERSTLDQYEQHLRLHINPTIGAVKLSKITVPAVRAFQEELREDGRSAAMIKRVTVMVINTLKEWKLACPKGELNLVFPNGEGNVEWHQNIIKRGLHPTLIAAGVTSPTGKTDRDGEQIMEPKYTGLHALPRGNRKTSLGAGLGLLHVIGPENVPGGECLFAASDRKQALRRAGKGYVPGVKSDHFFGS